MLICFSRAYLPNEPLIYVRYLVESMRDGYYAGEQLLPAFAYTARPTRRSRRLTGAVLKYAGKPHYDVLPASAIVHGVCLQPAPSLWERAVDRGEDTVCARWYQMDDDLLYHEAAVDS